MTPLIASSCDTAYPISIVEIISGFPLEFKVALFIFCCFVLFLFSKLVCFCIDKWGGD